MTETEDAVLQAAKQWLAKEAVLAADEARHESMETERALDKAEANLTNAVYRLLGREPVLPPRD
jgi:hypothetical protein